MPVRVDIPIRIRTDVSAVLQRGDEFDEALARALSRAFTSSQDEVLRRRGGYVNVVFNQPEYRFTGKGAIRLSQRNKQELQDRITETIVAVSKTIGIEEQARDADDIPVPLSEPAIENLDLRRFEAVLGVYALPSYDDNGQTEHVDVEGEEQTTVIFRYFNLELSYTDIQNNYRRALEVMAPHYQQAVQSWGQPSGDLTGLIWKSGTGLYTFYIENRQTSRWRANVIGVQSYRAERSGTQVRWSQQDQGLPNQRGIATFHSISEAENLHRRYHGTTIRRGIEEIAPRQETMTRERYRALVDQAVENEILRRSTLLSQIQGITGIIVIDYGGSAYIGPTALRQDYAWQGEATLYPVLERIEIPAGSGEGRGEGEGQGQGEGGRRGRGGIAPWGSGQGEGQGGAIYPSTPALFALSLTCQPYMGEPSVDEMGEAGEYIKGQIREIATRLQISTCDRAGNFLINAAQSIASRASDIGNYAAINESSQPGFFSIAPEAAGNMGEVNFVPNASPAIQFMRFLAGTVPLITQLSHFLDRIYTIPGISAKFSGTAQNNPYFWLLRFHYDLRKKMELAVGTMFIMSCRVLMLQFLLTSKKAIDERITHFNNYAPLFQQLMIGEMADIHELRTLHGRLTRQIAEEKGQRGAASDIGEGVMLTWNAATSGISDLFHGYNPDEPEIVDRGFIKRRSRESGLRTVGIYDNSGHRWLLQDLETTLAIRQNIAESVDPLVKQIRDVPELLNRFRQNPNAIRNELWRLLHEMSDSNTEVRRKVVSDWTFAFEASKIQENIRAATIPGTRFPLQGIHLQVHQQLGEFFRGDLYYAIGINALFGRELGIEALKEFFIFTGLTLLAVICAPLAVAVGAGIAAYEYHKAQERLQVFRAMIDPEVVMSQAELEAELFAAELGLALSFIPYAGRVLGTSARVGKVVIRQGVRGSARVFARYGRLTSRQVGRSLSREGARQVAHSIRDRFTRQLAEQLKHGFAYAVLRELAEDQLMDVVLQKLLFGPALQRIYSDFRDFAPGVTSGTGTILQPQPARLTRVRADEPEQ